MEKSTPIGLVAGFGLIFGAIFLGDGWATFFDPAALTIVLGGTVAALLVGFSLAELKAMPKAFKEFFGFRPPDLNQHVELLAELARVARREGLLALDRRLDQARDPLVRLGLEMTVDGVEAEEIEEMLRTRIEEGLGERKLLARFCDMAAIYAPAFGMIGTLIGLIQMLQNLNDPAAIGPAMAVAMITTFYGALLANLVFLPMAGKVKEQRKALAREGEVILSGILGLVRGESPGLLERRLRLYVDGETPRAAEAQAPPAKKAA